MKAERRHELRENDLAHMLEQTRDYVKQNSANLGLLIGAVVVIAVIVTVTVRSRAASAEQAWRQRGALSFDGVDKGRESLASLQSIVSASDDAEFQRIGWIDTGMHALRLAQEVDDPPDIDFVDTAELALTKLLTDFGQHPLTAAIAHDGLATVAENRFAVDGSSAHKEKARKHLQAVIDNPAVQGLPPHQKAVRRLESLDRVFTIVRFADAIVEDEPVEEAPNPISIKPVRVPEGEVPPDLKLIGGNVDESNNTDENP